MKTFLHGSHWCLLWFLGFCFCIFRINKNISFFTKLCGFLCVQGGINYQWHYLHSNLLHKINRLRFIGFMILSKLFCWCVSLSAIRSWTFYRIVYIEIKPRSFTNLFCVFHNIGLKCCLFMVFYNVEIYNLHVSQ
jgi:hypothetical protein